MQATDRQRLAVLAEHGILDTESSPELDRITALAAAAFSVPTALFTLVDEKRQWFKSRIGFPRTETPREIAFCAATIEGDDVMVIEDATRDPRFLANELVIACFSRWRRQTRRRRRSRATSSTETASWCFSRMTTPQ